MDKNENILKLLKNTFENEDLKLPGNVEFLLYDDCCTIKLNPYKVQAENMQTDTNAFEAWTIAIYVAMQKNGKVILDVNGKFKDIGYEKNGHWGRFLYRASRFAEQYNEWFRLSDYLQKEVTKFEDYLCTEEYTFTNNLAKGEAGVKEKHGLECQIEAMFSQGKKLRDIFPDIDVGNNAVYRQLPVGLFRSEPCKPNVYKNDKRVFTGGKSAIDLWTWKDGIFEIIELKADNIMMGIITEIFFYANYMYDLLHIRDDEKNRFHLNTQKVVGEDRGYSNIRNNKFVAIRGIMLADKYHPILNNEEVLKVLKCNSAGIEYCKAKYKYKYDIQLALDKAK